MIITRLLPPPKRVNISPMKSGKGQALEIYLDGSAHIHCPSDLIPAPGQYLLASAASDSPLAVPIFLSESTPDGFRAAPPLPSAWTPGTRLQFRGPFGHGFALPTSARRVALIAFDDSPARLRGLIAPALKQSAAITLVCDSAPEDLSEDVEIQPLKYLNEIWKWADYAALDVARENLPRLMEMLGYDRAERSRSAPREAQVLIRTSMPCGTSAECGVCAVNMRGGWKMACKDGPVFNLNELL